MNVVPLIICVAVLPLGLLLSVWMMKDRDSARHLKPSLEGPNEESVLRAEPKTALDGPVGSSPALRQVASGRKNVQVLNGFIFWFNVIAAIGLVFMVVRGLSVASDGRGGTGVAVLGTFLGAVAYVIGWLMAWALISLMKNILGAVTESLALNVERADSDDEPVKAAA